MSDDRFVRDDRTTAQDDREVPTDRLLAFSDGVFAIAITLLVLNLTVPLVHHGLLKELLKMWPDYLSYALSFVIIGIIWAQNHYIFRFIGRTDHAFVLLTLFFLLWIVFLPFPTRILAQYLRNPSEQQTAMSIYAGTFLFGTLPFNLLWRYASGPGHLLKRDADPVAVKKTSRSYAVGPLLYLIDFGLSFVSVSISLILFLLIALLYAVLPLPAVDRHMGRFSRS